MYKQISPKLIQNAIYLFMVYVEYVENIAGYFSQEEDLDFL